MSGKKELLSTVMKRISEWIASQEIPSDITIHVGETSFLLHKIPLVSKCGFIKKLASESSNNSNITIIRIPDFPGGAESFELAIKLCYDISFEMKTENIVMLRCAAAYLEMTEEHSAENLVEQTEVCLNEVILNSLLNSVEVLKKSEDLLPMAERVRLVSRCIDAIAYEACQERSQNKEDVVDWWAEDLAVLRIDMFRRVLVAMMARRFKHYTIGPVLRFYAEKALKGLETFGKAAKKIEAEQELEKRVIVETTVSLLPRERDAISFSFLSMLLKAAIYLETTVACRLDLEKRMGLQLRQAVLDDLLIPSQSIIRDNTMFDVDIVQRIFMNYLEFEIERNSVDFANDVGELMETYLPRIASDRNLNLAKLIGLAESIPQQSRVTDDGMYRAIDIYLKLSREVCAHAAQNDRLPVKTVVQVLYYEQRSLREIVSNSDSPPAVAAAATAEEIYLPPEHSTNSNEVFKLNRESQGLKLELLKVKMKLKELEKEKVFEVMSGSDSSSPVSTASVIKPRLPRKSFLSSVSTRLGKLNPFSHKQVRTNPPKGQRHSIS